MAADLTFWLTPRSSGEAVRLAVGSMNFGETAPEADAHRVIDRAFERGLVLFDTANMYGNGASEEILGRALRGKRDRAIIATKVGIGLNPSKPEGLEPARVRAALDESLKRLGTDYVDLYYFHTPDHQTPIEASLEAASALVSSGKTRAIGLSNYSGWMSLAARHAAHSNAKPVIGQVLYNLLIREVEIEYLRFAETHKIHTTVYNPLAGGLLAGHHRPGDAPTGSRFQSSVRYQRRYWSERFFDYVDTLKTLAAEAELSLVQLSYRWLASKKNVDSILIGPRTIEHLDAAIDAVQGTLEPELLKTLDKLHREFLGTDTHYAR